MKKLKTLKDFEIWYLKEIVIDESMRGFCNFKGFVRTTEEIIYPSDLVCFNTLKQEAIKLLKLSPIEKAKLITGTPRILLSEIIREDVAILKAFQYFFNITDGDLQ